MTEPQAKYEDGKLFRHALGEDDRWVFMSRDEAELLASHLEDVATVGFTFLEERDHYIQFAADIRTAIKAYEREHAE